RRSARSGRRGTTTTPSTWWCPTGRGRAPTGTPTERSRPAYEDRGALPAVPGGLLRGHRPVVLVLGLRGRRLGHAARRHTARLPDRPLLLLLAPALPRPQVLLRRQDPRGRRPPRGP